MRKIMVGIIAMLFVGCSSSSVPDCAYVLPADVSLKQNKRGRWAILNQDNMLLGFSSRYNSYGFYSWDSFEAKTFPDSCNAKGFAKAYLQSESENSFK